MKSQRWASPGLVKVGCNHFQERRKGERGEQNLEAEKAAHCITWAVVPTVLCGLWCWLRHVGCGGGSLLWTTALLLGPGSPLSSYPLRASLGRGSSLSRPRVPHSAKFPLTSSTAWYLVPSVLPSPCIITQYVLCFLLGPTMTDRCFNTCLPGILSPCQLPLPCVPHQWC